MLKIWILDSGRWWHYALLDIKSHFPQYEYETYLDYENAPYWNRTGEEIFKLTQIGCKELWDNWCELILIACNTICAQTLKRLQDLYPDKKILWCIIPSCEIAVEVSSNAIGIIATKFTVESQKYEREIHKLSPNHIIHSLETPELAGFVEANMQTHNYTLSYLKRRIDLLVEKRIDTIILACTHYTVFHEYISERYPHLKIIDSAKTQTIKLAAYVNEHFNTWK